MAEDDQPAQVCSTDVMLCLAHESGVALRRRAEPLPTRSLPCLLVHIRRAGRLEESSRCRPRAS